MTMTLRKLPAILLAVVIAAALALGLGASLQPAYAEETAQEYYLIVTPAEEGDDTVLPGQKLLMKAEVYDAEGENVTGSAIFKDPQWKVTDGQDYASYETVAGNPKETYLVFDKLPEDQDEGEVYASLQMTAEVNGQIVVSNAYPVVCARSYAKLVCTELDPYLMTGKSQEVTGQIIEYSEAYPEGIPRSDGVFTWEDYDEEGVGIDPVKATGESITSTITRKSDDWNFMLLHAVYKNAAGEEQNEYKTFAFQERSSYLQDYEVLVDPDSEDWRTVIPEGTTHKPVIKVMNGDFELPEDAYDIVVERYIGYDSESGEDSFEEYCRNFEEGLAVSEKDAVNEDGIPIGGTNTFRITAVAKEGSGYEGSTEDYPGYVFLYSDKTLNDYSADIKLMTEAGEEAPMAIVDVYPYLRYEVNPGTSLTPVITIGDKQLNVGTDCELSYVNINTMAESAEFPAESGEYNLFITGKGEYYGTDDSTYVKIGETNKLVVKTKKIKAKARKNTSKKAISVKTRGDIYMYKLTVNGKYYGKLYNKISVKPNGIVTVKKGLKKGTYMVKVLVSTPGDENYLAAEKTVTLKIKVK